MVLCDKRIRINKIVNKVAVEDFKLLNLPLHNAIQNFYISGDTAYITQVDQYANAYITKVYIDRNSKTAQPAQDSRGYFKTMKIEEGGHANAFDVYWYNDQMYFLCTAKDNTASNGTQMSLTSIKGYTNNCEYKESSWKNAANISVISGQKVPNYSSLPRIYNFKFGTEAVKRVDGFYTVNEFTMIELDAKNRFNIRYFDGETINKLLASGKNVNLGSLTPKKTSSSITNVHKPNICTGYSWQANDGVKSSGGGDLYFSGNPDGQPQVKHLSMSGSTVKLFNITSLKRTNNTTVSLANTELEGCRLKYDGSVHNIYVGFILNPDTNREQVIAHFENK